MLIETRNLSVRIGKTPILSDITMSIQRGEIVTIIGPNGSGKSTLMRTLIGALLPCQGEILRSPGLRIGYVPQRLHIDETLPLTVRRFLQLPRRRSREELQAVVSSAGAQQLLDHQLLALSGGQLQRVVLARALLDKPDLLLLDEPTQGLDRRGTSAFYHQIASIRQQYDCAVILVSHDLRVVMRRSERVICLNGHICCEGKPDTVGTSTAFRSLFGQDEDDDTLALYQHREHDRRHSMPEAV